MVARARVLYVVVSWSMCEADSSTHTHTQKHTSLRKEFAFLAKIFQGEKEGLEDGEKTHRPEGSKARQVS